MVIARQGLTLAEFLALPEEKPALEYFEGVVTQKVVPKARHSLLQGMLTQSVNQLAWPRKLALAFPELRTTYQGASIVPDVSVFRWERIRLDANGEPEDDCYDPPDVAIEIRSPGQSVRRLVQRCEWYVANGVALALLVDPLDRSVRLLSPGQAPRVLRGDDPIDLGAVVPELRFTVNELFGALRLG